MLIDEILVGNCRIIYNQTSCPQINYAVPFNPTLSNISAQGDFTSWYNGQFDSNYQFFNYSLQQVACDTSPDSQYSLAVTCEDCRNAYTDWLCAVLNPRCHDFSSPLPYLQPRAIGYPFPAGTQGSLGSDPIFSSPSRDRVAFNSSRNPAIDSSIQPGPYKELLPCGDLCHSLVRSCPAIMGFACPYNPQGYNFSYGYPLMDGLNPECNDPRAVFGVSSGRIIRPAFVMLLMGLFILSIAIG